MHQISNKTADSHSVAVAIFETEIEITSAVSKPRFTKILGYDNLAKISLVMHIVRRTSLAIIWFHEYRCVLRLRPTHVFGCESVS